ADVHVKIDTGMGRLGIPFEDVAEFANALRRFKNIRVDGLMTHFAAADEPTHETLTKAQIERFEQAVRLFRDRGHGPTHIHSCNSAGVFSHTEAFGNMVRPGGVLYGLWRDVLPPTTKKSELRPVMTLHSKIMFLKWAPEGATIGYGGTFKTSRKTLVATIPIGYDDGYLRGLSNRSQVTLRETHAPVIGRISMDLTILDVTDVVGVELGDTVTLFGGDKEMQITVEELAGIAGTLSYEVTCGIGARVPRLYLPRK
ncbi:MAG: alanine racemase, partial [Pyrinomonadaceae bacterium]